MSDLGFNRAASPPPTKEHVRELAMAYHHAEKRYSMAVMMGTSTWAEDEIVDHLIEIETARKAKDTAYLAFHAAVQAAQ